MKSRRSSIQTANTSHADDSISVNNNSKPKTLYRRNNTHRPVTQHQSEHLLLNADNPPPTILLKSNLTAEEKTSLGILLIQSAKKTSGNIFAESIAPYHGALNYVIQHNLINIIEYMLKHAHPRFEPFEVVYINHKENKL